jgi:carboxyl-terminal processing protease
MLKYSFVFVGVCALLGVGFIIGRVDLYKSVTENLQNRYTLTGELKSQYKGVDVNILWETWARLENEYINSDNIDAQNMVYGAIKGMVSSLNDPYTNFLTPQDTEEYQKSNKGEYEGIGATLRQEGSYVVIETVLDKSPAKGVELKAGDIILEVDKENMENKTVYEAVAVIRGDAGTVVELKIWRQTTQKEITVSITRSKIDIDNVEFEKIDDNVGKVIIHKFTETDVVSFNILWDSVVKNIKESGVKKLIIDLRNNPGGYVSAVEYVLGDFIPQNSIIFMEENVGGIKVEHRVSRVGRLLDMPIVVLVNEGSASASEIFAGTIQDYSRGKVVGMKTVGKGVEQKVISLSDGSILQVVFQKWLTPKGRNITKKEPITPEIIEEDYKKQEEKALEILNNLNN